MVRSIRISLVAIVMSASLLACSESTETTSSASGTSGSGASGSGGDDAASSGSGASGPGSGGNGPGSGGGGGSLPPSDVVINEISAAGDDFVELYNAGDAAFDLAGFGLCDTADDMTPKLAEATRFVDGETLEPGAFLVVVADLMAAPAGPQTDCLMGAVAECYHATWGISAGNGERIFLVSPEDEILAEAEYAPDAVPEGQTIGHIPDGEGALVPNAPTPGWAEHGAVNPGSDMSPLGPASYVGALLLIALVVLSATLVNRFAPQKRGHIRRASVLLLIYLVIAIAAATLPRLGISPGPLPALAELVAAFTAIGALGMLVFDLALPKMRIELATIVADLVIGIAYVGVCLAIARRAGMDFSGIVATSAVVTGILALSMQATLGNVVGGVALQLDRSIRVGDWLHLENGRQGRVHAIRWRHTVLETRDWDTIIVPNAALLAANIVILGKRDGEPVQHRIAVHFNVDYRHAPSEVIRVVEEALRSAPVDGVARNPPPSCTCRDFARERRDSFGYYAVWYWLTDLARDEGTDSRVRERIFTALKRADIPLAMPAAHLWIEQDSPERRERKVQREQARRARALSAVEFLKPLTSEEVASVAALLYYAPFTAGETITQQGAVAHWLYILARGAVEVRVTDDAGAEEVVASLRAPSFFGEMGLMTGEPRGATVVATSDVVCYRLDKDAFHSILSQRPEVATEISALLAQRGVELQAAREHLDAGAKQRRVDAERKKILGTIQSFFGLDSA